MAIEVTDATFPTEVVERSKQVPVVVDLWAEWCGPCKQLGPILEQVIAETNGKVVLAKVDVDSNPQVSGAFQVQGIPAVYALRDGKVVDHFVGAQPEATVRTFVEGLLPAEEEDAIGALVTPATRRRSLRSPSCWCSEVVTRTWPGRLPFWSASPSPPRRAESPRSHGWALMSRTSMLPPSSTRSCPR